jgi:hypothetical protein
LRGGLHNDHTAISQLFRSDFVSIAHRWPSVCVAICGVCEAIARRFRSDYKVVTYRFHGDCPNSCRAIAQQLQSDRAAIVKRSHSNCKVIVRRNQSDHNPIWYDLAVTSLRTHNKAFHHQYLHHQYLHH